VSVAADVRLAVSRALLAAPDLHRIGPYWRLLRRLRVEALRRRGASVAASARIHERVFFHRGLRLTLGPDAEIRDRVRLGVDEPGLAAGSFALGAGSVVLSDCHLDCSAEISVGRGSHVGRRNQLYTHDHDVRRRGVPVLEAPITTAPIAIGDDVMLYNDVVVLPGVTIGDGAVVGIRSIVTRDVPPYARVAGAPARVIGYRE
jgi:acetyltransferase-like isoleucine patch superfamily enzyme